MSTRRLVTGITLLIAVAVLCVMALWGYHALTAPLPTSARSTASPTACPSGQKEKITRYVRRADVTVSVYNSGSRKGRAQATMDQLERAGFQPGQVGNAPSGVAAKRAVVYTVQGTDDPAAKLVALSLGRKTRVAHNDNDLGPGLDVVIGDRFNTLDAAAPDRLKLARPTITCE